MVLAEVQENDHDRHCRPGGESQQFSQVPCFACAAKTRQAAVRTASGSDLRLAKHSRLTSMKPPRITMVTCSGHVHHDAACWVLYCIKDQSYGRNW